MKTITKILLLAILLIACSTENKNNTNTKENEFIVQDSLIQNVDNYERRVYFGYEKIEDKLGNWIWKDYINIYHIKNNSDTLYSVNIPFYRTENEGQGCYLDKNNLDTHSFILRTVSGNAAFSDNVFEYIPKNNNYFFQKRIYNLKVNDRWEKFDIPILINVNNIDSTFMNKIFEKEYNTSKRYE